MYDALMLSKKYFDKGNAHYNAQMKTFVLKYALRNALSDGCYQKSKK